MDGIIFDVDGTLWDSTAVVARAWRAYLDEKHIPTPLSPQILKGLFGMLLSDIAKRIFPGYPEEDQLRMIEECCILEEQALRATPAPLYPGMEETLAVLSASYPLFIVSNCQAGYIECFLDGTGTGRFFQDHLCPGDSGLAKGENICLIARRHGLTSPVYVGDTQGDYEACQKAKVPFIHAGYGFGQVPNAPYRILRPQDLPQLIAELSKAEQPGS